MPPRRLRPPASPLPVDVDRDDSGELLGRCGRKVGLLVGHRVELCRERLRVDLGVRFRSRGSRDRVGGGRDELRLRRGGLGRERRSLGNAPTLVWNLGGGRSRLLGARERGIDLRSGIGYRGGRGRRDGCLGRSGLCLERRSGRDDHGTEGVDGGRGLGLEGGRRGRDLDGRCRRLGRERERRRGGRSLDRRSSVDHGCGRDNLDHRRRRGRPRRGERVGRPRPPAQAGRHRRGERVGRPRPPAQAGRHRRKPCRQREPTRPEPREWAWEAAFPSTAGCPAAEGGRPPSTPRAWARQPEPRARAPPEGRPAPAPLVRRIPLPVLLPTLVPSSRLLLGLHGAWRKHPRLPGAGPMYASQRISTGCPVALTPKSDSPHPTAWGSAGANRPSGRGTP